MEKSKMSKKENAQKIKLTAERAENALRDIIVEGSRISQAAVEKRAGLSNGALNYNIPLYRDIKTRIILAKEGKVTESSPSFKSVPASVNESRLKDKYRSERDSIREELAKARGEVLELRSALFDAQQYIKYLESKGLAHSNVVNFKSRPDE
tara:strand:+ start:12450 stop:12905 length:456 start_codon:yes stop_codon:yes gene_type:complete